MTRKFGVVDVSVNPPNTCLVEPQFEGFPNCRVLSSDHVDGNLTLQQRQGFEQKIEALFASCAANEQQPAGGASRPGACCGRRRFDQRVSTAQGRLMRKEAGQQIERSLRVDDEQIARLSQTTNAPPGEQRAHASGAGAIFEGVLSRMMEDVHPSFDLIEAFREGPDVLVQIKVPELRGVTCEAGSCCLTQVATSSDYLTQGCR